MAYNVIDQMGREVLVPENPQRIVSLVPSQTELLWYLGLQEKVVGITKFCIHPDEWIRSKVRIGGTKNLNVERIKNLRPDLIIGNKEENTQQAILQLEEIAPVWMSDVNHFEGALQMIHEIGKCTNKANEANELVQKILQKFSELPLVHPNRKVLYFIWKEPDMVAGNNTFIHEMIQKIGWENACNEERYPVWEKNKWSPEIVLLSSEPYPFNERDVQDFQDKFPAAKVIVVDGEMFSWYGARMLYAPSYFKKLVEQLAD